MRSAFRMLRACGTSGEAGAFFGIARLALVRHRALAGIFAICY